MRATTYSEIQQVKQTVKQWQLRTPFHILKLSPGLYQFDIRDPLQVRTYTFDIKGGSMTLVAQHK